MMSSHHNEHVVAGPSRLSAVFGIWRKKANPSPASSDAIEATTRIETSSPNPSPLAPSATPREPHSASNASLSADPQSPMSHSTVSEPPPYTPHGQEVTEVQPWMYSVKEPPTLARMLFIYGFLFFPFWLAGIYILFSPLLPTPDWEAGKTEAEKEQFLHFLRDTEKKWAKRCLYAMLSFTIVVFLLVVIIKFGILATI